MSETALLFDVNPSAIPGIDLIEPGHEFVLSDTFLHNCDGAVLKWLKMNCHQKEYLHEICAQRFERC